MKKSVKAALYSVLVCPGTGHFLLRRWWRGLLFMLPVLGAAGFIVNYSVDRAFAAVDEILAGEVAMDPQAIEHVLEKPPPPRTALFLDLAKWAILACWIGAGVDAFRLGRRMDKEPAVGPDLHKAAGP